MDGLGDEIFRGAGQPGEKLRENAEKPDELSQMEIRKMTGNRLVFTEYSFDKQKRK